MVETSQTSLHSKEDSGRRRGAPGRREWQEGQLGPGNSPEDLSPASLSADTPSLPPPLSKPPGSLRFSMQHHKLHQKSYSIIPSCPQSLASSSCSYKKEPDWPYLFPKLMPDPISHSQGGSHDINRPLRAIPGIRRPFSEIKDLWGWAVIPQDGYYCSWSTFIL